MGNIVGKEEEIKNGIPIFEDITKLSSNRKGNKVILSYESGKNGSEKIELELEEIQAIQGGFPCQPYSSMGKRQGSDDPRALFGHIIRLLDTTRPRWFVGENVTGFLSLGLDRLLTNLDYVGYDTWTCFFPAASQNAPTMRHRVFIIGFSREYRNTRENKKSNGIIGQSGAVAEGNNKSENEGGICAKNIGNGVTGQAVNKVDNEKEIAESTESISNSEERRAEENFAEVQDTRRNQETVCSVPVCPGQSEISFERKIWAPCDTGVYNGKDFLKPEICRVRNGNGARVSKDYIAQIMAAGNAVNPIQIYPLIRYLKHIDDLIINENSEIRLHEEIKRKAKKIIEDFSPEQQKKLNENFLIVSETDDKTKLYSANENYRPYRLYVKVKCNHKLYKKMNTIRYGKKKGCNVLCDTKNGKKIWVSTSFHNVFKTSQLFTEIVLNSSEKKYIDNQPLVDEIFKQLIEKSKFHNDEIKAHVLLLDIDDDTCKLAEF